MPLRRPGLCYAIGYLALAVVALASLVPAPDMGSSDKLLHFVTYGALSAGYTLLVQKLRNLVLIALGLVCYGIVLEFLQGLTGYRMSDPQDMLANSLGVAFGLVLWWTPLPYWFQRLENRVA